MTRGARMGKCHVHMCHGVEDQRMHRQVRRFTLRDWGLELWSFLYESLESPRV